MKLRITTIVWTVCTLIVSRQVVLSRRKKRGIICGRRRNSGLMVNNEIEGNSWKLITNREELCLKLVRLFEKKKEMSFDERTRFIAKCADLKMENYY